MLSGCPSCGGNKFQFKPASSGALREPQATTRRRRAAPERGT
nr:Zn-ribbon containing protein [Haloferax sp. BAB-2207]